MKYHYTARNGTIFEWGSDEPDALNVTPRFAEPARLDVPDLLECFTSANWPVELMRAPDVLAITRALPKADDVARAVDELVGEIGRLEPYQIQGFFDGDHDGSCPCFYGTKNVGGYIFKVHGRCWRVSEGEECQDLLTGGNLPQEARERIARAIKYKLDKQEWYRPYQLLPMATGVARD